MKIACYGELAEIIGREVDFAEGDTASDVGALRRLLAAAYPDHADKITGTRLKVAVDDQFAGDDYSLDGPKLVELLPPVSGG